MALNGKILCKILEQTVSSITGNAFACSFAEDGNFPHLRVAVSHNNLDEGPSSAPLRRVRGGAREVGPTGHGGSTVRRDCAQACGARSGRRSPERQAEPRGGRQSQGWQDPSPASPTAPRLPSGAPWAQAGNVAPPVCASLRSEGLTYFPAPQGCRNCIFFVFLQTFKQ